MLVNKVENARRRLLIRPGAIGDFIVSLPALEHLAAPYTEVWTSEANLPLVRFAQAKRSIISAGLDRLGLLRADDVIARLREFDSIVSWYGANRPEFRTLVAEAGLPFEFHRALPPGGGGMHAVDYYCSQVGLAPGAMPRLDVGPVESHGSVVFHPFASSRPKRWTRGAEFRLTSVPVVRIRGPEDDLPGALYFPDLWDLARYLGGALAYVGNDSGTTHLAAAIGIPTVALFGPTDPAVWAPRGNSVKVIQAGSMAGIAPETVVDALRDFGIY